MKRRIGFIGLGAMGKPMAQNLLKAGHEMYVCDINTKATIELQNGGAHVIDFPRDVAKAADVVMTMLATPKEVEQVYLGETGLLSGVREGLVLIDSSTIDPDTTRRIGLQVEAAGAKMIDAPVGEEYERD